MSDPQDDKTARKRIADDVWCRTCDTVHIAYIPVTTFRCADCGFGQWDEDLAESHASAFPSHVVYSLVHAVEPPMTADPVRPQETLRERLRDAAMPPLHQLEVQISGLDRDCACGIVAEVVADAVLPIVEEETKALREENETLRLANATLGSSRPGKVAELENALSALRDKVKALESEERFDVAHHLAEIEPRDDLDKYILDRAIETVREIERRLRALVEEPQGGEGQ